MAIHEMRLEEFRDGQRDLRLPTKCINGHIRLCGSLGICFYESLTTCSTGSGASPIIPTLEHSAFLRAMMYHIHCEDFAAAQGLVAPKDSLGLT